MGVSGPVSAIIGIASRITILSIGRLTKIAASKTGGLSPSWLCAAALVPTRGGMTTALRRVVAGDKVVLS